VTPQLPFVVWILAGALAAVLFGNLVFDLAAWL
jgi:prepilin signal peptidase PulO-like enzyme (type II secretory pathway)